MNVINVDALMERGTVLHMAKNAISVVTKTTIAKCADPVRDPDFSLSQGVTQEGLDRQMRNVLNVNAEYMR